MSKKIVVAIDGPAGSGKSTSAKLVAQRLGYLYIDTGAMYRAVTYLAIKNDVLNDTAEIIRLAENADIDLSYNDGSSSVFINGEEVTDQIRSLKVNQHVSDVSKIEQVRKALVSKQQLLGDKEKGVVMEGRDIGTVVFPDADVKIFLTASLEARASRRAKEFDGSLSIDEVKQNIKSRDSVDSTRESSPLVKAEDAIEIDTSGHSIEEQVDLIIEKIKKAAFNKNITF
jgi:CMP/dCMP kinase